MLDRVWSELRYQWRALAGRRSSQRLRAARISDDAFVTTDGVNRA